ncbi:MAG: hypothetical protein ABSG43_11035 [Solirubrobacteraceae bacterium]
MALTVDGACARDNAPGLPAHERALERLRAAVARDQRIALATRRVRAELAQAEHYTDEHGTQRRVSTITRADAEVLLTRLRADATRLYRGELGGYLLRRYPHPSCQWVWDEYLRHVAAMTPLERVEAGRCIARWQGAPANHRDRRREDRDAMHRPSR